MKRARNQDEEDRASKRNPIVPIAEYEYALLGESGDVTNLVSEVSSYNPACWWICTCGATIHRQHYGDYACPCDVDFKEVPWRDYKMTNAFDTLIAYPKNTIPHLQRMMLKNPSIGLQIESTLILCPFVDVCACMHLYQTTLQKLVYIPKELWPEIHKYFVGRMHHKLN